MIAKARRYELAGVFSGSVAVVWALVRLVTWVNEPEIAPPPPPPIVRVITPAAEAPRIVVAPVIPAPPLAAGELAPELKQAIQENDPKAIAMVWTTSSSLHDAIKFAVKADRPAAVAWLLDKGANADQGSGGTEHLLALADDFPDVSKVLLAHGASELELDQAASLGAVNAVTRILAHDKNAARGDAAALDQAIESSAPFAARQIIIDKLLVAGAAVTSFELEAATEHCGEDKDECLALLKPFLARRIRVTGDALSAASALPEAWRDAVFGRLLAGNLAPNATAAFLAKMTSYPDTAMIKSLAPHGIMWGWHDEDGDATPMSAVIAAAAGHDVDALKAMLDAGAQADWHDEDGASVFLAALAADGNDEESDDYGRTAELLVRRGANVNRRFGDDQTPLFKAVQERNPTAVKAIVNAGARVNERVDDQTALDLADSLGDKDLMRLLASRGGRRAQPMHHVEYPKTGYHTRGRVKGLPDSRRDNAVEMLKAAMGATENTL